MAEDTSRLIVEVQSKGVKQTSQELTNLTAESIKAEKAAISLGNAQIAAATKAEKLARATAETAAAEQTLVNRQAQGEVIAQKKATALAQLASAQNKNEAAVWRSVAAEDAATAAGRRAETASINRASAQARATEMAAAALRRQAVEEEKLATAQLRRQSAELALEAAQQRNARAMNNSAEASRRMASQTGLTRMQLLTLQYTFNDVVASLASGISPMTILLQQGGQVTQAWGGLGQTLKATAGFLLSWTGVALAAVTAVGALAYKTYEADEAQRQFMNSMKLSGGLASMTYDDLISSGDQLSIQFGITASAAKEMLTAFATSGDFTRNQIENLTTSAVMFSKLSGQGLEEVTKQFLKAADSPGKFADSMKFLSAAQVDNIKDLEQVGRKTEALDALSRAMYEYLGRQAPNELSNLSKFWLGLKSIFVDVSNEMGRVGQATAVGEKFQTSYLKIAALEKAQQQLMAQGDTGNERRDNMTKQRLATIDKALEAERGTLRALQDTNRAQLEKNKSTEKAAVLEGARKDANDKLRTAIEKEGTLTQRAAIIREKYAALTDKLRAGNADDAAKIVELNILRDKEIDKLTKADPAYKAHAKNLAQATSAYDKLMEASTKVIQNQQEQLATGEKLSDSEKAILRIREALGQSTTDLNDETVDYTETKKKFTKAQIDSLLAQEKELKANQTQIVQLKMMETIEDRLASVNAARTKATDQAREEINALKDKVTIGEAAMNLDDQAAVKAAQLEVQRAKLAKTTLEEAMATLQLRKEAGLLTEEEQKNYDANMVAMEIKKKGLEEQVVLREKLVNIEKQRPITEMAKNLESGFKGAVNTLFTDLANKQGNAFKNFGSSLKNTVVKALSDAFYDDYIKDAVKGLSKMLAEAIGGSNNGTSSGGGILKGLMDAVGNFFNSSGSSSGGSGGGFMEGIGKALSNFFGGSSGGGGASSSGGFFDSIGKFFGGNSGSTSGGTGSSLTSTLGQIGSYVKMGTDLLHSIKTGEGWGATVGSIAGSYFGPIGTMIGSALGGAIDKLFGGGGGPKSGGSALSTGGTMYGGNMTEHQADSQMAAVVKNLQQGIDDTITKFGGRKGVKIGLGYSMDNQGDAQTQIASRLINANGQEIFGRVRENAGRSEEELQKNITLESGRLLLTALKDSGLSDQMMKVFGNTDLMNATQEQVDAMLTQLNAMNDIINAFKQFGAVIPQLTNLSFEAQESLVGLSGGIEKFNTALSSYYDNFYTAEEKTKTATDALTKELSNLGLTMPTSREGFRKLVEAQDLSTEKGRATYAALISLSKAFADLVPAVSAIDDVVTVVTNNLEELKSKATSAFGQLETAINGEKSKAKTALDARLKDLNKQKEAEDSLYQSQKDGILARQQAMDAANEAMVRGMQSQIDAAQKTAQDLRAIFDALRVGINTLIGSVESLKNQTYESAKAQINKAAIDARMGRLPNMDDLGNAISIASQVDSGKFGSAVDLAREQLVTAGKLGDIQDVVGNQMTAAERQVTLLQSTLEALQAGKEDNSAWAQAQIALLDKQHGENLAAIDDQIQKEQAAYDAQIANLDQMLATAKMQLEIATGTYKATLSLADAMYAFNESIKALTAAMVPEGATTGMKRIPDEQLVAMAVESTDATAGSSRLQTQTEVTNSLDDLKDQMYNAALSNAGFLSDIRKLINKWDGDGTPPARNDA